MLEISLENGDYYFPIVEIEDYKYKLITKQAYNNLSNILLKWVEENNKLKNYDYNKFIESRLDTQIDNVSKYFENLLTNEAGNTTFNQGNVNDKKEKCYTHIKSVRETIKFMRKTYNSQYLITKKDKERNLKRFDVGEKWINHSKDSSNLEESQKNNFPSFGANLTAMVEFFGNDPKHSSHNNSETDSQSTNFANSKKFTYKNFDVKHQRINSRLLGTDTPFWDDINNDIQRQEITESKNLDEQNTKNQTESQNSSNSGSNNNKEKNNTEQNKGRKFNSKNIKISIEKCKDQNLSLNSPIRSPRGQKFTPRIKNPDIVLPNLSKNIDNSKVNSEGNLCEKQLNESNYMSIKSPTSLRIENSLESSKIFMNSYMNPMNYHEKKRSIESTPCEIKQSKLSNNSSPNKSQKSRENENLKESTIIQDNLKESTITQENLKESTITQENLKESSVIQENLKESSTNQDNLNESSLVQENLKESSLVQENLKQSSLIQENLKESSLVQENSVVSPTKENLDIENKKRPPVKVKKDASKKSDIELNQHSFFDANFTLLSSKKDSFDSTSFKCKERDIVILPIEQNFQKSSCNPNSTTVENSNAYNNLHVPNDSNLHQFSESFDFSKWKSHDVDFVYTKSPPNPEQDSIRTLGFNDFTITENESNQISFNKDNTQTSNVELNTHDFRKKTLLEQEYEMYKKKTDIENYLLICDVSANLKKLSVAKNTFEDSELDEWDKTITGPIYCMSVSEKFNSVFLSVGNGFMLECDIESQSIKKNWGKIHTRSIYALALANTMDVIFTGGIDKELKCWDIKTGNQYYNFGVYQENSILKMVCTKDDKYIYTAGADLRLQKIAIKDNEEDSLDYGIVHRNNINNMLQSDCGNYLITSACHTDIKIWSIKDDYIAHHLFEAHNKTITSLTLCGESLISGSEDGVVKIWEVKSGVLLKEMGQLYEFDSGYNEKLNTRSFKKAKNAALAIKFMCVTKDHKYLFAINDNNEVIQWDIELNVLFRELGSFFDNYIIGINTI